MAPLGRAALLLAFGLVLYALVAGSFAAWKRRRRLALSAQNALLAAFPVTLIAVVVLVVALGRRDMTFVYVWQHTSHKLPLGYALAFWGGQEGSLLLWLLVLTGYGGLAVWLNRRSRELVAWTVPVFGLVGVFFAFMLCFVSSPFHLQPAPAFGRPLQGLPLENLQARVRGTTLMEFSNAFGHLLLTTGNKSEISVGYCTLYGDTNGGLGLIGDLYKTEVFALSRHVNEAAGRELIPRVIIDKEPSAELAPGQRDTDSLPPYPVLDEILKLLIEGRRLAPAEFDHAEQFVAALRAQPGGEALVARVRGMIARNEYKRRQAPPIIRVRSRAFGSGRQMPIAAKFA